MGALIDLTGQTFGLLTVIYRGENNKFNKPTYWCKCACGNPNLVLKNGSDLSNGNVKSCGCLVHNRPKKEKIKKKSFYENIKEKRIGEIKTNTDGDLMELIEYNSSFDITIKFLDEFGYIMEHVIYNNFKKGTVKNPYHRGLYNKGYIGVGNYLPSINRKTTEVYDAWRKMFDRCYSKNTEAAYKDCNVCQEWENFQVFAEWYTSHFWKDEKYPMQIDKDWKIMGNKTYSPKACEIVPSIINSCLVRHDKKNNNNLPIGIQLTASNKFKARLSKYGKRVDLGTYSDLKEAMQIYKTAKIQYIHELANLYKEKISQELYEAMMDYETRFDKELPEYAEI